MPFDKEMLDSIFAQNDEVTVDFTKVNGEVRVMRCTKNFDLIPESLHPINNSQIRVKNENVYPVFDLDKQEWRSFRIENVNSVGDK